MPNFSFSRPLPAYFYFASLRRSPLMAARLPGNRQETADSAFFIGKLDHPLDNLLCLSSLTVP